MHGGDIGKCCEFGLSQKKWFKTVERDLKVGHFLEEFIMHIYNTSREISHKYGYCPCLVWQNEWVRQGIWLTKDTILRRSPYMHDAHYLTLSPVVPAFQTTNQWDHCPKPTFCFTHSKPFWLLLPNSLPKRWCLWREWSAKLIYTHDQLQMNWSLENKILNGQDQIVV